MSIVNKWFGLPGIIYLFSYVYGVKIVSKLFAPNPKPKLLLGMFFGENITTFLCPSCPDPAA